MSKEFYIDQYHRFKNLNKGKKPLHKDFLKFCNIHNRKLEEIFGRDSYSRLQEECGDIPNRLLLKRTPKKQIFDQYGELVRIIGSAPVIADWTQAKLKPSAEGISKVHNIKWSELPNEFIKEYSEKIEWNDVIEILKKKTNDIIVNKKNKVYFDVVEKILNWTPNRKRIIEEGYKIELRNYLEKYFHLEEEVGDSNADLLVSKKIPIEIKKDPSQSEYDRLLGQMIRHNKLYGNAIAVITNVSSEDRFKKFKNLFDEIHLKLDINAEIIKK